MPTFLYDLPSALLGALVTGAAVLVALVSYAAFRRAIRTDFTADDRALAMAVLAVVATVNSLLLAFSAVSVWEAFGAAEEAVVHEGDSIGELARDLAVFDSAESRRAREVLRDYTRLVADKEWNDMRSGNANQEAWLASDEIFRAVGAIEPDTPRRRALLPEIWARTNELLGHRRDRLYTSQAEVPGTLWIVVLAGCLTVLTTFVLPVTRFNVAMIAVLALSLGLVFFFIIAMDRPFAGQESIRPGPFVSALENMRRWDATPH